MSPKGKLTLGKRFQLRLSDSSYKFLKKFSKQLKIAEATASRKSKAMVKAEIGSKKK